MSEWKDCKILNLGDVVGGATPSTKKPENYENGTIAWITPKDLSNFTGRYISRGERNITETGLKSCSTQLMPPHSVLFSSRAPIGYIAIAETEVCTNQGFKSVIPNKNTDYLFLYYLLKYNRENIEHMGSGTTFKEVSGTTMRGISVRVPVSFEEQRRIGSFLGSIDDKIEENERINKNLAEQAQAVFLHMFPANSTTMSGKIADVALNVTDGVHNTVTDDPDGDYLLLSCKNITSGSIAISDKERRISKETFDKLRKRTSLSKGDILLSSVGTVGELLLLNTDPVNFEFQRSVAIIKPSPNIVSSVYIYESLLTRKSELIHLAHGAVQQCIFIGDIKGFPIEIPEPDDLATFNNIVQPMMDQITQNQAENDTLARLRDSLLPRLMSGELDVSNLDL